MIAITLSLISISVTAQEKWSVEVRPSLGFPLSDVGNIDAKIGYGFEAVGAYKVMPHLAVYAGWSWNQFRGDDSSIGDQITFDEKGYTFGLHIIRNIGTSPFSYFGSVGAIYNSMKFENNARNLSSKTDYGFGWQVALGVDYEFASNFSLRPTFRYRSLSRDFEVQNVSTDMSLKYISFGIGLVRDF